MGLLLVFNSLLLGIGLAMDAFSVSLADGLNEPKMKISKILGIAGVFAVFQGLMPFIGWVCVHTAVEKFSQFEPFIPWIALALLGFIGGKMLLEGIEHQRCIKNSENDEAKTECPLPEVIGLGGILLQGVATSIDALSVGFTISDYSLGETALSVLIIALTTFLICLGGIILGKRFGTTLAGKSSIFGGAILIFIGIEIFISSFF